MRRINILRSITIAVTSVLSVTFLIMAGTATRAQAAGNDARGIAYSVTGKTPSPSPGLSPSTPSTSNDSNTFSDSTGNGMVIAPLHEGSFRTVPGRVALAVMLGLFCGSAGGLIVRWCDGKHGKTKRE